MDAEKPNHIRPNRSRASNIFQRNWNNSGTHISHRNALSLVPGYGLGQRLKSAAARSYDDYQPLFCNQR